jgi:hypothetical protein
MIVFIIVIIGTSLLPSILICVNIYPRYLIYIQTITTIKGHKIGLFLGQSITYIVEGLLM